MKNLFYIEVTDCYAGEPNYSWVTRHIIRASSYKGAVNKFSRLSGMNWRYQFGDTCDGALYKSKSGATCYFISEYDAQYHADYNFNTDERQGVTK